MPPVTELCVAVTEFTSGADKRWARQSAAPFVKEEKKVFRDWTERCLDCLARFLLSVQGLRITGCPAL
jgi:hypothetical protein